jgi:4'-phosphopantetheinyl transferase EntD
MGTDQSLPTSGVATLFRHAVVVDTWSETADASLLWPEEEAALGPVVEGRRRDYVLGRRCARQALGRLGVEPRPVLRGPGREPLWPAGVVGSITHTSAPAVGPPASGRVIVGRSMMGRATVGYAAAVVARSSRVRSVGIDAEPDGPLPAGVLDRIVRPEDRIWVDAGPVVGVAHPDRLLFTIKEAVYKAWFPLAGRWLGFDDAYVELGSTGQRFRASIVVDGPIRSMTGRYATFDGIVVAAIEV